MASETQKARLGKALTATSIGLQLSGPVLAATVAPLAAAASQLWLGPSKAFQRRRKAGAIVESNPILAGIKAKVEAIPARTRDEAAARLQTVLGGLNSLEANELANLVASLEGASSQLQRQFGRTLFAPDFTDTKSGVKWQGPTLPFGSEGPLRLDAFRAAVGLPAIARDTDPSAPPAPSASGVPAPTDQPNRFTQAFENARASLGLPTSTGGGSVPYFNSFFGGDTTGMGGGSPLSSITGLLGQLGSSAITAALTPRARVNVFQGGAMPQALPGGAAMGAAGGLAGAMGLFDNFDVTPGFSIGPQGASGITSPWRTTPSGSSAQPHLAVNPTSGRITWFGPLGRPMLWSGDMRACKRVARIARKAKGRRVGGR